MFIPGPGSWCFSHPGSRIPDPGSRIPDPKISAKERGGGGEFVVIPFFVAKNFTKFKIIFFLKCRRKKFGPVFKELWNFLPKNMSLSSKKYGIGIRVQGSKRHWIPDPGSQVQIRNTGLQCKSNIFDIEYRAREGNLFDLVLSIGLACLTLFTVSGQP